MIRELAHALKDVLRETDEGYLEREPEDAYVDLAARLIFRLSSTLTIVPYREARRAEIARTRGASAARIFDIFTAWLHKCPECSYTTERGVSGKYELVVRTPGKTHAFFQGESVQDVYAQAAQTIEFNEGRIESGDDLNG